MRVLIGCECSGAVRRAFRALGHDAWSCDFKAAEDDSPYHIRGDVLTVLGGGWDMAIYFPDCTYLTVSGLHWNKRRPERVEKTEAAIEFVRALDTPEIPRKAWENPIGCLSSRWRKPDQIIQPYQFGHDASKATCLWLDNLPLLTIPPESEWFPPRIVNGRRRWANQTDSGQNKLGPSPTRAMDRARTYHGIADAMAAGWGKLP